MFALALTLVQGQTLVSLRGTAPADVRTIYFSDGLFAMSMSDSVQVVNGIWQYERFKPAQQIVMTLISDVDLKARNTDGVVALMIDSVPTQVDMAAGTVKGSKASESVNNAVRGIYACMKKQPTVDYDPKEEALGLMLSAVMGNLDTMLPVLFVPMIADGMTVASLQQVFYEGAPYADHPKMRSAKQRLALLSGESVRS